MLLKKESLYPNYNLIFKITENETPGKYDIYWKILNRGEEAKKRDEIRGQIVKGEKTKNETTKFSGDHIVECYIVQNNVVVAKDRIHVPIYKGVY